MIISKDSWIIHIFAALHAIVSFVCYSTGIADELMLTLLTMFLVVMLCFRRRVGVLFMAIAVILVNPLGFSVGMGLPRCCPSCRFRSRSCTLSPRLSAPRFSAGARSSVH